MKKIVALIAAAVMSVVSAFALEITVGPKALAGVNFSSFEHADTDVSFPDASIGGFANFGLTKLGKGTLGVQPELSFVWRWAGFETSISLGDDKLHPFGSDVFYFAVEFPVFVTYKIPLNKQMFIQPELGLTFAVDSLDYPLDVVEDGKSTNFNVGIAFGAEFGVQAGPGTILGGLRYHRDFTENNDFVTFQNIDITVAYGFKL